MEKILKCLAIIVGFALIGTSVWIFSTKQQKQEQIQTAYTNIPEDTGVALVVESKKEPAVIDYQSVIERNKTDQTTVAYLDKLNKTKDGTIEYKKFDPVSANLKACGHDQFQVEIFETEIQRIKKFNQFITLPKLKLGKKNETYPQECKTLRRGCGPRYHGERFWEPFIREVLNLKKCSDGSYEITTQAYEIEKICIDTRLLTLENIRPIGEPEISGKCKK